jgi:hypothetical protein
MNLTDLLKNSIEQAVNYLKKKKLLKYSIKRVNFPKKNRKKNLFQNNFI